MKERAIPAGYIAVDGREMRAIMKQRHISLAELSRRSGVSYSVLTRISHSGCRTTMANLRLICSQLRVAPDRLTWPEPSTASLPNRNPEG